MDKSWMVLQEEKMRLADMPPWKMARWGGMLVVGNMLGMLPAMAVPNKEDLGADLSIIGTLLTPLGCALGIWLVGNIGRWEGSLKRPLLGCYLTLPAYLYGMNVVSWTTILGNIIINSQLLRINLSTGAYCFKRQWRRPGKVQKTWYTRLLILSICGSLYLAMWSSYIYFNAEVVHNGDKIKLRDAVGNFIKSPAVKVLSCQVQNLLCYNLIQEFWRNLQGLWQHMLHNGFWSTWTQLVDSLDPFGEKNALKTLGLQQGASQEEIRSKYRELTKVHHPDKVKGTIEEKEAAQEKFVQIQQAYDKLSDLKRNRAKANKRQQESESGTDTTSSEKIEL